MEKIAVEQITTWYNNGMMEDDRKEIAKACEWFKKIIDFTGFSNSEIVNIQRSAKFNLGCKLIELGEKEEGLKWFYDVADNENHPGAMYYIGVHLERENHVGCIKYYVEAANLGEPRAISVLHELGLSHLVKK